MAKRLLLIFPISLCNCIDFRAKVCPRPPAIDNDYIGEGGVKQIQCDLSCLNPRATCKCHAKTMYCLGENKTHISSTHQGRSLPHSTLPSCFLHLPSQYRTAAGQAVHEDHVPQAIWGDRNSLIVHGHCSQGQLQSIYGTRNFELFSGRIVLQVPSISGTRRTGESELASFFGVPHVAWWPWGSGSNIEREGAVYCMCVAEIANNLNDNWAKIF